MGRALIAAALLAILRIPHGAGFEAAAGELWRFDRLDRLGNHPTRIVGHPKIIEAPFGKAVQFDGKADALFVDTNPLAGATTFTWEVLFRPDMGGAPEQRFIHLQERDPKTGENTKSRLLLETRIAGDRWFLDSVAQTGDVSRIMLNKDKLHPLGRWYHVALVYDGRECRNYVDGILENSGEVHLGPQEQGHSSAGVRINLRYFFKGAIAFSRTTRRALAPHEFLHWAVSSPQPKEMTRVQTYTEGPVFDRDGNLFFTHNEGIAKLTPAGELSDWVKGTEAGYNGHKILPDGTHLVCASKKGAIWRLAPDARFLGVATESCDGKHLRGPNDITLDGQGGYYFTDPDGSRQAPIGTIHYVDRSGKTYLCYGGMRVPNGLVVDFDRNILYVAESVFNRIDKFSILSPGKLGPLEIFANLPAREGHDVAPDGITIDTKGNVYVAHLGTSHVLVLEPSGKVVQTYEGGNYDVSNLAFGGPQMSQLFITGSITHRKTGEGRVYRLDLDGVRGRR